MLSEMKMLVVTENIPQTIVVANVRVNRLNIYYKWDFLDKLSKCRLTIPPVTVKKML